MLDIRQRLFAELDRLQQPMTAFLQRLVQFPSLPGEEQQAQHFIADKMRSLGCDVNILRSDPAELEHHPAFSDDGVSFAERLNVVARWPGAAPDKARSLILNGHMDVVPVGNLDLWKYPPFSGAIEDGLLHGRGACDMKAGLTSAIFAIEALRNIGQQPQGDVLFQSVIGEESGGVGTLTTIVKGFRADAAIIMEPTRLQSCPVHAGALSFKIVVNGRAIHASMKKFGVSALEKFQQVFQAIEDLDRTRHQHYHNPIFEFADNIAPISIGTVAGGDWFRPYPNWWSPRDVSAFFPASRSQRHVPLLPERWKPSPPQTPGYATTLPRWNGLRVNSNQEKRHLPSQLSRRWPPPMLRSWIRPLPCREFRTGQTFVCLPATLACLPSFTVQGMSPWPTLLRKVLSCQRFTPVPGCLACSSPAGAADGASSDCAMTIGAAEQIGNIAGMQAK